MSWANRPRVQAGLALLEAGGDFAEGVIAWDRSLLGEGKFASFDGMAVSLLTKQGHAAQLL